jgi:translation initiation factor IF-2
LTKLRVYEYAKQLNMSSKEIITILSRLDIPVNNHMSVMESGMVEAVEGFFSEVKSRAAARTAAKQEQENARKKEVMNMVIAKEEGQNAAVQPERAMHVEKPVAKEEVLNTTAKPVKREEEDEAISITGARTQAYVAHRPMQRTNAERPNDNNVQSANTSTQSNNNNNNSTSAPRTGYNSGNNYRRPNERPGERTNERPGDRTDRPAPRTSNGQSSGNSRNFENRSPRTGPGNDSQRRTDDKRPSNFRKDAGPGQRTPSQGQGGAPRTGQTGAKTPTGSGMGNRNYSSRSANANAQGGSSTNSQSNTRSTWRNKDQAKTPAASAVSNQNTPRKRTETNSRDFTRTQSAERRENSRKLQQSRSRSQNKTQVVKSPEGPKQVTVDGPFNVGEFARLIRREASEVIKKLLFLGILVTINQEIDTDTMVLVGAEFGTEVIVEAPRDVEAEEMLIEEVNQDTLETRPPVVTIMGHVDHGKTTLLDAIRETNVTATEAGGITQHIGAYQVEINNRKITFLDTPGHAAFTTMRARGAQITDITVLVVAADDGVMPQTVEAINHAKAANVPIIVAINKVDKLDANLDRIKQELTEHGLVAEEWGGDTIFVPISALKKQGIEELLEMILLVADMADLKASKSARARGTVIEAELDKGRGPVATVLVQTGMLHIGDVVVAGNTYGKIRAMVNAHSRRVKEASASMPVEIIGLSDVPSAGDLFVVYDDERQARIVSERRTSRQRVEDLNDTSRVTLDDLYKQIQEGEIKELNLILKGDVHGSVEAVIGALQKIDVSGVRVKVIHTGVGAVTESDILLASASNAIVIGFNVRPEPIGVKMAEAEKVEIRLYRVIYNLIEDIESALKGLLDPVFKEVVVGHAEIRQLFKVSKVGTIAGGYVQDGKMIRDADVRLLRNGVIVYEGKLDSLKRFKEDAKEVNSGYECGFTLGNFNDIKEGDIVEVYKMEAVSAE